MAADRRLRLLGRLVQPDEPAVDTARLCRVCAELTGTTGAGIMVFGEGGSQGSLGSSDSVSSLIEELQFTLGEGPCIDASRDGHPVLEPDLGAPADTGRWIAFAPPAVAGGARAVFGFPLRVGTAGLGALNLYRDRPGPLTDDQYADALVLADLAGELVLLTQAGAPPGELAMELAVNAGLHAVVHQASGMVSVQMGVRVEEALVRLRAYAFRTGIPLLDVARSVVRRSLRFGPDGKVVEP
ncbi:MAG: GAF and ANTAR domain-containing protein [Ilumatobacteraceae bacterium]